MCPPQKPSAIKVLHRPRLHLIDLRRRGAVSCRSARRIYRGGSEKERVSGDTSAKGYATHQGMFDFGPEKTPSAPAVVVHVSCPAGR